MKDQQSGPGPSPWATQWEQRPWNGGTTRTEPMSRRMQLRSRGPYDACIPVPLAQMKIDLPAEVTAESEDALTEIIRFDAELATALPVPERGHQQLAPLSAVLLRTESASSSQIEKITAGAKALALASIGASSGPNARLVVANVAAMEAALELSQNLSEDSIKAAHAALLDGQEALDPGRYRSQQVWIGGSAPTPHTATFVPPHPDRVPAAMSDLLRFIRRTDVPVLTHAALAHAQFETIHPFADGNGRTGRALIHAMLHSAGRTNSLTIPVSAGLLSNTSAYFAALMDFRNGDPAPVVQQLARAGFKGVHNGRLLAQDILDMHGTWQDRVRSRRGASVWALLPLLIAQPAITTAFVVSQLEISTPAAQTAIDHLVEIGVLQPVSSAARNRVWVAGEVIAALDAFGKRARRA
ncbi:Fic family protein [Kocuria sp.]|uniref:Fic family protein n=1 Tax=Kocuria sp. TaxID=1871328 RepID=UPI0026DF6984|nr:Fic family protein [Kocuria sp.]MDO5618119.1 Fic family protein [Kocuria sp.]